MFSLEWLIDSVKGELVTRTGAQVIKGVSIDSRTLEEGNCFFAVRGPKTNGHAYLLEASQRKASAFIVDSVFFSDLFGHEDEKYEKAIRALPNLIVVQDTTVSLGLLAHASQYQQKMKSVGITGSCGKTTTKEYTSLFLATRFNVHATRGNLNNQYGVPLTILDPAIAKSDVLVCEMGASEPGDIQYLARLVQPQVGVITNVGPVHLEGLKSVENVYAEKLGLGRQLENTGGTLIVYGDDEKLVREARNLNVNLVTFGRKKDSDFVVTALERDHDLIHFELNARFKFSMRTIAACNVMNAVAALAVADYFTIDLTSLRETLLAYEDLEGRFRIIEKEVLIIDDAYNANPYSFKEALRILKGLKKKKKKILVCGDMLELGERSEEYHRDLGYDIVGADVDVVIALGTQIEHTLRVITDRSKTTTCFHCDTHDQAIKKLKNVLEKGDAVLVKASHGIGLEAVVRALEGVA